MVKFRVKCITTHAGVGLVAGRTHVVRSRGNVDIVSVVLWVVTGATMGNFVEEKRVRGLSASLFFDKTPTFMKNPYSLQIPTYFQAYVTETTHQIGLGDTGVKQPSFSSKINFNLFFTVHGCMCFSQMRACRS